MRQWTRGKSHVAIVWILPVLLEGVWALVTIFAGKAGDQSGHVSYTSKFLYDCFIVFILSTTYSLNVYDPLVSAIFFASQSSLVMPATLSVTVHALDWILP